MEPPRCKFPVPVGAFFEDRQARIAVSCVGIAQRAESPPSSRTLSLRAAIDRSSIIIPACSQLYEGETACGRIFPLFRWT